MNWRWFVRVALVLVSMPLFTAQACGPDFFPDVFVMHLRPDHPKEFARGQLGVLLPTYPRADLAVAFRYLNGGQLNAEEQSAYQPTYAQDDPEWQKQWNTPEAPMDEKTDPASMWRILRARYSSEAARVEQKRESKLQRPDGGVSQSYYENCSGDAFLRAVATLQSRVKTWVARSADLADWLQGQDAVFSHCESGGSKLPSPVPAGSSALLKADRAYQIAAAQFYSSQEADARRSFEAIAVDKDSPWHGLASYLVARCLVRQAFFAKPNDNQSEMASFDPVLMLQAAGILESLLKTKPAGVSRSAIQKELDLVRLRIEPHARLRELAIALAGPKTDAGYSQHLQDLTWYLDMQLDSKAVREDTSDEALGGPDYWQHPERLTQAQRAIVFSKTYIGLATLRSTAPLVDWLITFQSPAKEAKEHALAQWKKSGELCWLVAAITKASDTDTDAPALLAAAEKVSSDFPASELLIYHRARLLIRLNHAEEARVLLDQALRGLRTSGRDSSVNLYLGLRMRASENLKQAMIYAPRTILSHTSEEQASLDECLDVMKNPKRNYDCARTVDPAQFSSDAASFFNAQAPMRTLVDIANSEMLPEQLRRAVAIMAWTRSVLLKDDTSAAKLYPHLPAKLQQQAGSGTGFHAVMAILRNPGMRPYLDAGVQRSYSYDFVESYRDNWWCPDWEASGFTQQAALMGKERTAFLTPGEVDEAQRETSELERQGSAEVFLGGLVLPYAKDHREDEDVPESLYLVLRAIRYGCGHAGWSDTAAGKDQDRKVTAIKKAAARLLRQRYAASPWTKKAAPYAG